MHIDITYVKRDSILHRLHPLAKVAFEFCVFIVAAVFTSPVFLLGMIVVCLGLIALGKLPWHKFRYMRFIVVVAAILVATQAVWFTSFGDYGGRHLHDHILFYLIPGWIGGEPRVPVVWEGIVWGSVLSLRLATIALAFPLLVMTTHPSDLIVALTDLHVGNRRIPYSLVFAFATALRFVPTVSAQFDRTVDAQRARGVEMDGYNVVRRIKAAVPIFVPVLTSSIIHAHDLTLALETRAFGSPVERTVLREVRFNLRDTLVVLGLLALAIVAIGLAHLGYGQLSFAP